MSPMGQFCMSLDRLKAASCNRQLTALKAVLNWGVKREYFEFNPLARLDRLTEHDSDIKVRHLTDDERMRLMVALDAREKRMREERESHNRWLVERGRPPMPELGGSFADYLKPMVLVSLNSGIRRGTLFALKWKDIDFSTRTMTLRAIAMKYGSDVDDGTIKSPRPAALDSGATPQP